VLRYIGPYEGAPPDFFLPEIEPDPFEQMCNRCHRAHKYTGGDLGVWSSPYTLELGETHPS